MSKTLTIHPASTNPTLHFALALLVLLSAAVAPTRADEGKGLAGKVEPAKKDPGPTAPATEPAPAKPAEPADKAGDKAGDKAPAKEPTKDQPKDQPKGKDQGQDKGAGKDASANKDSAIGDLAPPPGEPAALPKPPAGAGAKEPTSPAKPKPGGDRKKAYIYVLDPNSVVKQKGPENSVVARGKLMLVIPDDEVILYCNAVDYTGETTGVATLTGDLKIVTGKLAKQNGLDTIPKPENIATGDIGYVFTKEKRAVLDGNVVVVHIPKDQAASGADEAEKAKHDTTTLFCDRLTYWYRKGDRKAVAQPRLPNTRIRFEQKTRKGTAGQATYYQFDKSQSETGDIVDLIGGVQGDDDKGQAVEAEVCRLFVDQDSSQWYNVKRLVVDLEEEETKPGSTKPAPGAPAAPGAPGATPGGAPSVPAAPGTPGAAAPPAGETKPATKPAEPQTAEARAAGAKPTEPQPAEPPK